MLSGKIPDTLGSLPQLRRIYLHDNQLSGEIPASLGRCRTLELVDLAYNKFTGKIPPEVAGLPNLHFYFNVSSNFLKGSLLEMSKMEMVLAIDVSVNNFSGAIPVALESCKELEYLNLSWNAFTGPIPKSLADLKNLEDMDLSGNNLNGTIPVAFKDMKMLRHLNLSPNRLTGEVPNGGVFTVMNVSAVMGNPGLCGTWINLPPCTHLKSNHPSVSKKVLIPVMIGTAILIMSLLLLAFSYRWRHNSRNSLVLKVEPARVTYEELVDATDGFDEANLLGNGSFGPLYKGTLSSGRVVAVKVLNFQDQSAQESFIKECNVLRQVRHRNVIKIISACSNLDFKALVLSFMSNGSLERWLYSREGAQCSLNLSDRLRIALEIAQGLAYLHHHCFVQGIHCDLKPSNVLLGDDMTPKIADFGIAKLFFENFRDSLTSTTTLKGSIGYIAPEYGMGCEISTKEDVYSYGILLLELLTRRSPTDDMFVRVNLQQWVAANFPNKVLEVLDINILGDTDELESSMLLSCLTQILEVDLMCTRELPQHRPNMMDIVERLDKIRGMFLGISRDFQLPIDISSLLESNQYQGNTNFDTNGSYTSTS